MSLGNHLVTELMLVSGAEPPVSVEVEMEGRTVAVTVSQWSPLALAIEGLTVRGRTSAFDLPEQAAQIASRLRYLSEPVRVLELDTIAGEAQLRSDPPRAEEELIEYFEITVARSGDAVLRRYRTSPDASRRLTPAVMTLETLSRVVDDLAA